MTADGSTADGTPEKSSNVETASPSASVRADTRLSPYVRWARFGYVLVGGVFATSVVVQVFIAGMAVFVNPARWSMHIGFVNVFAFFPFAMLALAFAGRMSRNLKALPVVLWVLVAVQYITAGTFGFGYVVAAVHPVNALVIFWLAIHTVRRAWARVSEPAGASS